MKKLYLITFASILLAGCSHIPKEAYYNRGMPESLLDVSSEVVNVALTSEASLGELTGWVNQDQPSRAELQCLDGDALCAQAQNILEQFGVPVQYVSAADNSVTLVYERIAARDCENRFIDNSINPYNLSHPTSGCSIASNMVQMISDKQQLVSPALLDYPDASKTVQAMDNYNQPIPMKDATEGKLLEGSQ